MSEGVEFDEDKFSRPPVRNVPGMPQAAAGDAFSGGQASSAFARWLIKKNIVKTEKAAQGVLIAIVAVNIIITFIILRFFL